MDQPVLMKKNVVMLLCFAENKDTYTVRCDSDFNIHSNVIDYCAAKCTPSPTYQPGMCDGSLCNETQCCNNGCNADSSYKALCDSSYDLYTRPICLLYCQMPKQCI